MAGYVTTGDSTPGHITVSRSIYIYIYTGASYTHVHVHFYICVLYEKQYSFMYVCPLVHLSILYPVPTLSNRFDGIKWHMNICTHIYIYIYIYIYVSHEYVYIHIHIDMRHFLICSLVQIAPFCSGASRGPNGPPAGP